MRSYNIQNVPRALWKAHVCILMCFNPLAEKGTFRVADDPEKVLSGHVADVV